MPKGDGVYGYQRSFDAVLSKKIHFVFANTSDFPGTKNISCHISPCRLFFPFQQVENLLNQANSMPLNQFNSVIIKLVYIK